MAENPLSGYDFPPELQVREQPYSTSGREIIFKYPSDIPSQIQELFKLQSESVAIVMLLPNKSEGTFRIRSSDAQARLDFLLFLLSRLKNNQGQPLYGKEIPIFPISRWRSLSVQVKADATIEDLRAIPELRYDKWTQTFSVKSSVDAKKVIEVPFELAAPLTVLLVAYFAPRKLREFYNVQADITVIELGIPVKVPIGFKLTHRSTYELTFVDHGPHSANDIRQQIVDLAVPTLLQQDCFIVTITDTDPLQDEHIGEVLDPFHVIVVRLPVEDLVSMLQAGPDDEIPDTPQDEPPRVSTRFLITKFQFTPEDEIGIKAACENYFNEIKLVRCKKCKCVFNASDEKDDICYEYYHTGERIPFKETGDMEEIEFDDATQEPRSLYNWSCCGESYSDDIPFKCGKRENGKHEEDPDSEHGSKFSWEKKKVSDLQ